jgi:hypothetical protein
MKAVCANHCPGAFLMRLERRTSILLPRDGAIFSAAYWFETPETSSNSDATPVHPRTSTLSTSTFFVFGVKRLISSSHLLSCSQISVDCFSSLNKTSREKITFWVLKFHYLYPFVFFGYPIMMASNVLSSNFWIFSCGIVYQHCEPFGSQCSYTIPIQQLPVK